MGPPTSFRRKQMKCLELQQSFRDWKNGNHEQRKLKQNGSLGLWLLSGLIIQAWIIYFRKFTCEIKKWVKDFPRGSEVKNLPASVGDPGSIPDPGRSHLPQSSWGCAPPQGQLLRWETRAPQLESSPHSLPLEKSLHSGGGPARPQRKKVKERVICT